MSFFAPLNCARRVSLSLLLRSLVTYLCTPSAIDFCIRVLSVRLYTFTLIMAAITGSSLSLALVQDSFLDGLMVIAKDEPGDISCSKYKL